MTEHDVAIARDQIRHLLALYNNCVDRGRIEELADVFAPDGVLQLSHETLTGQAAIGAALRGITGGERPEVDLMGSRHQLTTSRIEIIDEGTAQGWTYFFVSRRGVILQEGTYIDRYVRLPAGWRIAHRRIKMLWTVDGERD